MTPLTLAELRFAQASLALKAEKLRDRWRSAPSTGPTASSLGKQVKSLQSRADEYAALIRVAEGMEP